MFYLRKNLNYKKQYYFSKEQKEQCFTKEYFQEYMKKQNLTDLKVYEAKRVNGTGFFFCKEFSEMGESKESCGNICEKYSPRNEKNGICKHYGYVYGQGKEITLKKN